MRVEKKINFSWWNVDSSKIDVEHDDRERLEKAAMSSIFEMIQKGFTSGELIDDGEFISYRGWWDFKSEVEI